MKSASDAATAFAYFDSLAAVTLDEMWGRWRGASFRTGHVLDGVLESYGWYGKEFIDPDHVHPLLFQTGSGALTKVNPGPLPMGLLSKFPRLARGPLASRAFRMVRPLLRTQEAKAKLRLIEHRGVKTAAMIYDDQPITDVFRKVDQDTLLGVMDLRGMREPFFFLLERDSR